MSEPAEMLQEPDGSLSALQENLIQFEPLLLVLERVALARNLDIVGHLLGCALLAYRDEMDRRVAEEAQAVPGRNAHPMGNGQDWLAQCRKAGGN